MAYRLPLLRVQLVREGSITSETKSITDPKDAVEIFNMLYPDLDRECLVVLILDMKNRVRGINTVSIGDLSSAITHPREIFKPAILANAASIFMLHNHPSGDPTPSADDMDVSLRIGDAGELLGIELIDHVVVGTDSSFVSLKERGLF
jgi:DNA repair protein RadC